MRSMVATTVLIALILAPSMGLKVTKDAMNETAIMAKMKKLGANMVTEEWLSINSVSFVPSIFEIHQLIEQSMNAEKTRQELKDLVLDRETDERYKLLSKKASSKFLCPVSLEPDETILVTLGKKSSIGNDFFKIIADANMPFFAYRADQLDDVGRPPTSNGPNGVLIACSEEGGYAVEGMPRINLFYKDVANTKKLLNDYLQMRDNNINAIFNLFVDKLADRSEDFRQNPNSEKYILSEYMQPHYTKTVSLYTKVKKVIEEGKTLADCGISVVSYCQTWLRKGKGVGNAEFSVMSPHFQTRFYVSNVAKLIVYAGVHTDELSSYRKLIKGFTVSMAKDYGGVNGQAFVNLDKLKKEMDWMSR